MLPRDAIEASAVYIRRRVSVHLSVGHKAKRRITQARPYDSPGALVFLVPKFERNHSLYGVAKCRWGRLNSATFIE